MIRIIQGVCLSLALAVAAPAQAALKVLATTADWGALAQELGGDKVDVYNATSALQDVHRVEARPSLVARARSADLVVANGAELEIGWLPVLLQESGNSRIQPGSPGYFQATSVLRLRDVPTAVDRSMGDVHPEGNLSGFRSGRLFGKKVGARTARPHRLIEQLEAGSNYGGRAVRGPS